MVIPPVDTIVALATPPGKAGIGVVRVSGSLVPSIANALLAGDMPSPRKAAFRRFVNGEGQCLDEGLVLFFPAPHSFTGEDIVEFQGHSGFVVIDSLIESILQLGARMAMPGEFARRAFLNGKLDLLQVEAIADLVEAASKQAALSASRTLVGAFSHAVHALIERIITLRVSVESAIDFSDQDIEMADQQVVNQGLDELIQATQALLANTQQGCLLKEGVQVAILGLPNAGKSSLLNSLVGYEAAIVTEWSGTTRDLVREHITLDGLPVHIVDTAGLRETDSPVEQIGIDRAKQLAQQADGILWVFDGRQSNVGISDAGGDLLLTGGPWVIEVSNKCDLTGQTPGVMEVEGGQSAVCLSAKTGQGLSALAGLIKEKAGYQSGQEGVFIARRRHLAALELALVALRSAKLDCLNQVGIELVAEGLRQAQHHFDSITGKVIASDDMLGEIFKRLCIGK